MLDTDTGPQRTGNRHFAIAPQNLIPARDGLIAVAVETQTQLNALCALLGHETVALADSKAHEEAVEALIREQTAARTADKAVEHFLAHGVPAGRVQGMDDVAENPFTWEREILVSLQHPESGSVKVLGSPFTSNRSEGIVESPAPTVGQHTRQVLRDLLGYSDDRIDALAAEEIVAESKSP